MRMSVFIYFWLYWNQNLINEHIVILQLIYNEHMVLYPVTPFFKKLPLNLF